MQKYDGFLGVASVRGYEGLYHIILINGNHVYLLGIPGYVKKSELIFII